MWWVMLVVFFLSFEFSGVFLLFLPVCGFAIYPCGTMCPCFFVFAFWTFFSSCGESNMNNF
jgi:hypothetical protein